MIYLNQFVDIKNTEQYSALKETGTVRFRYFERERLHFAEYNVISRMHMEMCKENMFNTVS